MATRIFIFDKATENMFLFQERNPSGEKPLVGPILVRKDMFGGTVPEAVEVIITPAILEKKKKA